MSVNKRSQVCLVMSGLGLTILVALVRYLTGPEFAVSLFYLLPICLVTWFVGRRAGILISVASAMTWLAADLMMIRAYSRPFVPYVNETCRLAVFLMVTLLLSRMKNLVECEKTFARKDFLTGIANRRSFFELSRIEVRRANRYKRPLTIVYLDVDNFKAVNDRFGHSTGDDLLRTVAETIEKNIRLTDTAARLGGDEFGVLLRETAVESARNVCEKLREALLNVMKTKGWPVTVSMGMATYKSTTATVDQIIRKADNLMYSAKRSGKNKIMHETVEELYG